MKTDNYKSMFLKEQVKVLYDGCRSSVTGSVLIAAVIYITLITEFGGNKSITYWVLPILIIAILRGLDAFLFSRANKSEINYSHYLRRFATGSTLAAFAWGLYFWNVFPVISLEYQAFMILVVTGVASFAMTTLSFHKGVILPFLILVMLPIEIRVLMESSNFHTALSFMIPLYFAFQINGAKRINKNYLDNIQLQLGFKEKEQEYINLQYAVDQHSIVSTTNVRGEITYANKKMAELTQYTHDELIGANHRVVKCDEYSLSYWKNMWRTIANGHVWNDEIKNIAKDGTYYWVDSTIVPFMNEQGKPYQYISIRTDITKAKDLELQTINDKNDALIRAQVAQILQGQDSLQERMADSLDAISKAEGLHIQNKLGFSCYQKVLVNWRCLSPMGSTLMNFYTRKNA